MNDVQKTVPILILYSGELVDNGETVQTAFKLAVIFV
jgi:hypothetical protein